jgi:hypothetical protein
MEELPAALTEKQWTIIEELVYYRDGSLRDIYVLDTTIEDWEKWIDLVNAKYTVEFYNGQTEQIETALNKELVLDYLICRKDYAYHATIKLENIDVKVYFFHAAEIENDITPVQLNTVESHNRLVGYLLDISNKLQKPVFLTAENSPNIIHIKVDRNIVEINLNVDWTKW